MREPFGHNRATPEELAASIKRQERQAEIYRLADEIRAATGWEEWRAIEEATRRLGR